MLELLVDGQEVIARLKKFSSSVFASRAAAPRESGTALDVVEPIKHQPVEVATQRRIRGDIANHVDEIWIPDGFVGSRLRIPRLRLSGRSPNVAVLPWKSPQRPRLLLICTAERARLPRAGRAKEMILAGGVRTAPLHDLNAHDARSTSVSATRAGI